MSILQLKTGERIILDKEDFDRFSKIKWHRLTVKWKYGIKIYVKHSQKKSPYNILLHRKIMNVKKGQFIDHINGNTLDCRKANLRKCTLSQNSANSKNICTKKELYRGVYRISKNGGWYAGIRKKGKFYYLGKFDTAKEAAIKRDKFAKIMFGEFARLNFNSQ